MKPLLITALLSLPLLTSCGSNEPHHVAASNPTPVPVQTAAVAVEDWPELYEATGTVRARTAATISSKVMAYVDQVHVRVGDQVREGQPLITLDARDLDSNVRRAEAARAEVQSAIPEAEQGIAGARANLGLAQTTFNRMQDLASRKSISSQEFDEASARLKSAQANYEMARARRVQLDSKIAQAEQEVRAASITRDYAKVSAPFAGIVTARSVEPGNLASPGVPLLTIEREGSYRLEVSVEESRIPAVRIGQPVEVALEALDHKLDARVSEIVPSVDASSRAYTVKIDLPPVARLRSGAFGRAAFALGSRQAISVPQAAIQERGQLASVFVAEEGAARTRLVTAGRRSKDHVEILSGLNAGEKIVVPIPQGLTDGTKLEARQ